MFLLFSYLSPPYKCDIQKTFTLLLSSLPPYFLGFVEIIFYFPNYRIFTCSITFFFPDDPYLACILYTVIIYLNLSMYIAKLKSLLFPSVFIFPFFLSSFFLLRSFFLLICCLVIGMYGVLFSVGTI